MSYRRRCSSCRRWFASRGRTKDVCYACVPSLRPGLGGPLRKYPRARIGDFFGSREVTALLNPDYTRNERVRTRCKHCGNEADSYVFNLRDARPSRCNRCPRARTEAA